MIDSLLERAICFLYANTTADLRFDEHLRGCRYVVGPRGRLVIPAMVAMLTAVDTVLFVPECAEGSMELLVTLEPLDEHGPHGALTDRWRIYHGDPEDVRWAVLDIESARFEDRIIDGEAMMRANPLAPEESKLCRMMNQEHRDELRRLCLHFGRKQVEDPVMVGIDPHGLHVRRRFDVVRVSFSRTVSDGEEARAVLDEMSRAAAEAEARS